MEDLFDAVLLEAPEYFAVLVLPVGAVQELEGHHVLRRGMSLVSQKSVGGPPSDGLDPSRPTMAAMAGRRSSGGPAAAGARRPCSPDRPRWSTPRGRRARRSERECVSRDFASVTPPREVVRGRKTARSQIEIVSPLADVTQRGRPPAAPVGVPTRASSSAMQGAQRGCPGLHLGEREARGEVLWAIPLEGRDLDDHPALDVPAPAGRREALDQIRVVERHEARWPKSLSRSRWG